MTRLASDRLVTFVSFAQGSGLPRTSTVFGSTLVDELSDARDFIVAAWTASSSASIGWPAVKVAEVEAGTADPWIAMVGED